MAAEPKCDALCRSILCRKVWLTHKDTETCNPIGVWRWTSFEDTDFLVCIRLCGYTKNMTEKDINT